MGAVFSGPFHAILSTAHGTIGPFNPAEGDKITLSGCETNAGSPDPSIPPIYRGQVQLTRSRGNSATPRGWTSL
ncbi:hypothetical protein DL93DRAFT_2070853 [Clavulina sp. PMI_390]|nr:hypothetical protein DL93DRAFT_2070853 [Clavulina sp. PMI_390]